MCDDWRGISVCYKQFRESIDVYCSALEPLSSQCTGFYLGFLDSRELCR